MTRRTSRTIILTALAIVLVATNGRATTPCTHYASPTGGGDGKSISAPFKVTDFWPLAKPGTTLCLLDGEYTSASSMINPPQHLHGSSTAPITVRALNDGKVRINGQGRNVPVRLYYNDYFVLEGFNAHASRNTVVSVMRSDHNVIRRVIAWDAGRSNIFGIHQSNYNLLEDVAGWGIARKIFSTSQDGNYTTIRRAWGRWEGSHVVGPKMTYAMAYNNRNLIIENSIGTWSADAMRATYTLLKDDDSGTPFLRAGSPVKLTDYTVDQPYGIFAMDGNNPSHWCANSRLLGSIAYLSADSKVGGWLGSLFGSRSTDCFLFQDVVTFIQGHPKLRPIFGQVFDGGSSARRSVAPVGNRKFLNVTEIGGAKSSIATGENGWAKTHHVDVDSVSSAPNIFSGNGKEGARVCYRFINGTLTKEPLWPWPMNQRILDAMQSSGRPPVNVTKTIEAMFGPIPPACKKQ